MSENYQELANEVDKSAEALMKAVPDTMKPYKHLAMAAANEGTIDSKTKELMALADVLTRVPLRAEVVEHLVGVGYRAMSPTECGVLHAVPWHRRRTRRCRQTQRARQTG